MAEWLYSRAMLRRRRVGRILLVVGFVVGIVGPFTHLPIFAIVRPGIALAALGGYLVGHLYPLPDDDEVSEAPVNDIRPPH
jgi:hypothetical protein